MNENTVENVNQESVLDDAALAPAEPQATPISTMTEESSTESNPSTENEQDGQQPPALEPGWIKGRVEKAVRKAITETEQRMTAQFQATLAPLYESMMERQADDLVRSGEFRSKEIALEYIRLKNGQPAKPSAQQQAQQPTRDTQGRFIAQQQPQANSQTDPVIKARADLLARQAEKIKTNRGVDVMQAINTNPDYRQKVLSGEWDFYEVADSLQQVETSPRHVPPSPMRSPNGVTPGKFDVANMSDAQFAKLQAALASGKVFDATK